MEAQFEPILVELSTKENVVQILQELDQYHNGYDESIPLILKITKYQKQLSMLIDFA